jgi:hypothetical protein
MNRGGVTNLWARRGTASDRCLSGRPHRRRPSGPLDEWHSDPFRRCMPGRHALRARRRRHEGSLAAFVTAAEAFVAARPRIAARSPSCSPPTRKATPSTAPSSSPTRCSARRVAIDYCIVGEPTAVNTLGDMIKNGRRGSLSGKLTVKGIQGHIAYPHLAKNPIHLAAPAIAELARPYGIAATILSADHLADLQHPRRHRRRQRHPRQRRHRFQLPLRHRQHAGATAGPTVCASSTGTASTTTSSGRSAPGPSSPAAAP